MKKNLCDEQQEVYCGPSEENLLLEADNVYLWKANGTLIKLRILGRTWLPPWRIPANPQTQEATLLASKRCMG